MEYRGIYKYYSSTACNYVFNNNKKIKLLDRNDLLDRFVKSKYYLVERDEWFTVYKLFQ